MIVYKVTDTSDDTYNYYNSIDEAMEAYKWTDIVEKYDLYYGYYPDGNNGARTDFTLDDISWYFDKYIKEVTEEVKQHFKEHKSGDYFGGSNGLRYHIEQVNRGVRFWFVDNSAKWEDGFLNCKVTEESIRVSDFSEDNDSLEYKLNYNSKRDNSVYFSVDMSIPIEEYDESRKETIFKTTLKLNLPFDIKFERED